VSCLPTYERCWKTRTPSGSGAEEYLPGCPTPDHVLSGPYFPTTAPLTPCSNYLTVAGTGRTLLKRPCTLPAVCSLSLYLVANLYKPTLYRPICASVLSSYTDSVAVTAIVYYTPGFEALRVIIVCLYRTTDHASQDCSRQTPSQAACLLRFLLLTNVLFCIPLPLPLLFYPFIHLSF
jgi:hypothetical protein